jgi:hypothetical protein
MAEHRDAKCLVISNEATRMKYTKASNLKYNLQFISLHMCQILLYMVSMQLPQGILTQSNANNLNTPKHGPFHESEIEY